MAPKTKWNRRFFLVVLALAIRYEPVAAQGPQGSTEAKIDYASARREIQNFEAIVNNVVSTSFSGAPFALSQKTKGAYIGGYGVIFNFLVNIHRALVNTPFGMVRRGEDITPEQKRRRIEELKDKLVQTMFEYGESFRQLPKGEVLTIVAFFEDRQFPDEETQNKTVVLSVHKRDLDELARGDDRWKELKQRMKIIEY